MTSTKSVTGNQSKLYKGEAKIHPNQKVFKTIADSTIKRSVRVNKNTWIMVAPDVTDEEAVRRFNERYGV